MNCPSRTDDTDGREGWNQSPNLLAGTTREDFNGRTNNTARRGSDPDGLQDDVTCTRDNIDTPPPKMLVPDIKQLEGHVSDSDAAMGEGEGGDGSGGRGVLSFFYKAKKILITFGSFVGPGFLISVAYIDPGNYSTAVAAGASYQFKLLFIVLVANIIAIFLQSLCIKLGTVSGMDLAQMCRAHLPRWLNLFLYIMAEAAIIATDIAEVIGTAIALNLLIPKLPLVAGCAISIVDVLLILIFYRPNGSMKGLRLFEYFVMALVLAVVVCFCIQLSLIKDTAVATVFRGYLPSSQLVESNAIYQACGILGATVMPHSLYLGSGMVQPRLFDYDLKHGHVASRPTSNSTKPTYRPSISAIKSCLNYSIAELAFALFTFALFVNSAILIVAGASLYGIPGAEGASLFSIYDLLAASIAPAAGTIFALALLLSGISAGIVCTISGQMVSEGALNWAMAPWMRRLITRSISITPSIIIAAAVGKDGLTAALNGSQVALSVALPFISAPLIYFTCRNKFMTVHPGRPTMTDLDDDSDDEDEVVAVAIEANTAAGNVAEGTTLSSTATPTSDSRNALNSVASSNNQTLENGQIEEEGVKFRNHWISIIFAIAVWLVITVMNVANLVLLGLGK